VQGEVHDENAYVMGGVAGQAGLFGSAEAVWRLLVRLTNLYKGRTEKRGIRPETVRSFFDRRKEWPPPGFDAPDPRNSSAGRFFGPHTIGHLGFTGTSFWVDLDREIVVILLTNRVHPSRNNHKIKSFRPVLHDEIMKTLAVKK
jgi:CubicO group peptidase (beta-lactamase class C family)